MDSPRREITNQSLNHLRLTLFAVCLKSTASRNALLFFLARGLNEMQPETILSALYDLWAKEQGKEVVIKIEKGD